jgi:hypothetical protein
MPRERCLVIKLAIVGKWADVRLQNLEPPVFKSAEIFLLSPPLPVIKAIDYTGTTNFFHLKPSET